jgi:hypothetical protein
MPDTKIKPKARELRREAKALGVEGWEDMDLEELVAAVDEAKEGAEEKPAKAAKSAKAAKPAKATKRAAAAVEDDDDEDDEEDEDEEVVEETPAKSKKSAAKKAAAKAEVKSKTAKGGKAAKADAKAAKKATTKAAAKVSESEEDELPENGNPFQQGSNLYWMTEELIKGGKRSAMVKRLQKKISLNPRTRSFTPEEEAAEIDRRLVIVSQTLRNEHGFEMEREGRGADTVIRLWKE